MRRPAQIVACLALAAAFSFASAASAKQHHAGLAEALDLRVALPIDGLVLEAGSEVPIEWSAGRPLPPAIEEWEAFLSLDDGATFPLRVTPHLDASVRRVLWQVPALPVPRARLLLRFGNEHDEWEVDPGIAFEIRRSATNLSLEPFATRHAFAVGETARRGLPGVVEWVEGDRHGAGLTHVRFAFPWSRLVPTSSWRPSWAIRSESEEPEKDPRTPPAPLAAVDRDASRPLRAAARPSAGPAGRTVPLSLLQRWNV